MNLPTAAPNQQPAPPFAWALQHYAAVESTQALARTRPAWAAVAADVQTAGRGQRERSFTSDAGGLYVTAVVPFDGDVVKWRGFALAVGRAVLRSLAEFDVENLRLRWPNDVMIGSRKVGGILVQQGGPRTLLVGLGLNVTNRPWLTDPALRSGAGRLLDHTDRVLAGPAPLVELMLVAIRRAHTEFEAERLAGMTAALNLCWGPRRQVRLEAAGDVVLSENEGAFAGIDELGRVRLARPDGSIVSVPEHHIQRLVEVE